MRRGVPPARRREHGAHAVALLLAVLERDRTARAHHPQPHVGERAHDVEAVVATLDQVVPEIVVTGTPEDIAKVTS